MKQKTTILPVNALAPEREIIEQAARLIQGGQVVAFPTETVYGLGANAFDAAAVARIFSAKGRPANDPLIVHLCAARDLSKVAVDIPKIVFQLGEKFWPGPLTLVVPKAQSIPANVTAGMDTVAVRVPNHAVALALIQASRVPLAAPSANKFSGVSPTNARHVYQDLKNKIPLILDGGSTSIGVESTVLDCTNWPPQVLRPGGVSIEELRLFLGDVSVYEKLDKENQPVLSPGMLDKHYSPRARLYYYLSTDPQNYRSFFTNSFQNEVSDCQNIGVLIVQEDLPWFEEHYPALVKISLGSRENLDQIASNLYAGLREMDEKNVGCIFMHDFGAQGLGLAIRDRLMRAAYQVIQAE
jgi:L-threonylcarbamoyladenylate synthase